MSEGASEGAAATIAVVDDDPVLRRMLRAWLTSDGHTVVEFADGHSALRDRVGGAALVLLDLNLGDMAGLDLLAHLKDNDPELAVIVVSARREVDTVVAAMRLGAVDYLAKPLDAERARGGSAGAREATGDRDGARGARAGGGQRRGASGGDRRLERDARGRTASAARAR